MKRKDMYELTLQDDNEKFIKMKTETMDIEEFIEDAEKIVDLSMKMDNVFDKRLTLEHLKLSIIAGLIDSYKKGYDKGYRDHKENNESINIKPEDFTFLNIKKDERLENI